MALPKTGIELEIPGLSGFLGGLGRALDASQRFYEGTQTGSAEASRAYAKLENAAEKSMGSIASLSTNLDFQRREYNQLASELDRTIAKHGIFSDQAIRGQIALDRLGNAIQGTERDLNGQRQALERTQNEMDRVDGAAAKLGRAFTTAAQGVEAVEEVIKKSVRAALHFADTIGDAFGKAFDGGAQKVSAFGEVVTGALRRIGEIGVDALMEAGRATADFVRSGISAAGDVEQTLNVLQVAGKATDAQMAQVSQRAIALGSDLTLPATSAADASTAMLELTKAGLSVEQSMEAAKGTLQLAAAAETDAATAAQVMSSALNAFQLPASEAVHITDLLAGAANASQANIADLSMGFNQAGFMFSATGQKADDLAVSLAVLTKNGLTGSDAGTALKNAMNRLINPTGDAGKVMHQLGFEAYNAQGVMKPWPQIVEELRNATSGLTEEERNLALSTIFLSDGFKAMQPLLSLSQAELQGMYAQVTASGQAAELAGAQMKGWNGAVDAFNSQMETLGIVIGQQLLPFITPLLQQLGEAINKLTSGDFTGFFQGIADITAQLVARLTEELRKLAEGTSPMTPFLDAMVDAFRPLGDLIMAKLVDALNALTGWIETQAPAVLESMKVWGEQLSAWIEPAIPPLMEALSRLVDALGAELEKHKPAIIAALGEWGREAALALGQAILDGIMFLGVALGNWILEQEPHVAKALELWAAQFAGWVNKGLTQMLTDLGNVWNTIKGWIGEVGNNIAHEAGQLGNRLIEGFGNAIQAGVGWVRDQAWNMAIAARDAAFNALGVGSPSKVFEQIGAWTAEGMTLGLEQGTPAVQTAMAQMARPVALPGAGGGGTTTNVTNNRSVSMPIYTNNTPAAIQQSWAIVQAVASGDI